jgi:hypothetical protein
MQQSINQMLFLRSTLFCGIAAITLGCFAATSHAQPTKPTAPVNDGASKRERVKEKVRAMRAYFLTEELQLDSATAGKFFPVLEKYDQQFDALRLNRAALRLKVESLSDSKEIDTAIDAVLANQKALWDLETSRIAALRTVLSSKQMARMVFTLPTMENQIARRMKAVNNVDAEGGANIRKNDGQGPKQRRVRGNRK